MSTKRTLSLQVVLVVAGDAITFTTTVVTSMIVARMIPPGLMGTYRQILYLAPMAAAITEFGLNNTIYRYWNALERNERLVYVKMILTMSLIAGIGASSILALLSAQISAWYHNPLLRSSLLISSLFPLATIPLMQLRPILICRGNPLEATLLEMFFSLLSAIGLIIPLAIGLNFLVALAIWIIVLLIRLIAIPFVLGQDLLTPSKFWDNSILARIWEYEFPIQLSRIPGYIMANFDKVVMSLLLTTKEFAIYSLGAQELPFIGHIGLSVSNVLVPNLVEDIKAGRFDQVYRRWSLACERTAMATFLIATFSIWHAVPLMQLLFSAQYIESSIPFRVFASLTFLRVIEYASLAKALGRSDVIAKSSVISAGTLIILSFPLTHLFRGLGMALSFLLATLAAIIYYLVQYRRWLAVPISSFFPWPRLISIGILSLISTSAVSWLIGPMLALNSAPSFVSMGWKLAALFLCAGFIYVCLLLTLGFINLTALRLFISYLVAPRKNLMTLPRYDDSQNKMGVLSKQAQEIAEQ